MNTKCFSIWTKFLFAGLMAMLVISCSDDDNKGVVDPNVPYGPED